MRRPQPTHLILTATVCLSLTLVGPHDASAWDTAEHVQFGIHIAQPFEEDLFAGRIPVIESTAGASTFGHYVSAPDYGRGLRRFLDEEPSAGGTACAAMWTPAGVIDGVEVNDQSSLQEPSLLTQATYLDCLDGWRVNNSHFGDFATNHFVYYHDLALEAARRYRRTRQDSCRVAAYTLEAWGQHYLTDSTAVGHAWNPAGSYDSSFDWQTTNSVTQRMAIHNALNETGGRLSGPLYEAGVMWGDASKSYTPDGLSVPERIDDPQRALTLQLSRMALGQVVSIAECGGSVRDRDFFEPRADMNDARRLYASDDSMCRAMYGKDLTDWVPNSVDFVGLDIPEVIDVATACKSDEGVLVDGKDGALLARHFYQDKYYHSGTEDGYVHPALDSESEITLESLGCGEDLEVVPLDSPATRDMCNLLVCETPRAGDGSCERGMTPHGECCYANPAFSGRDGVVEATAWHAHNALPNVPLTSVGVVPGESSEFLWFRFDVPHVSATALAFAPLSTDTNTLSGGNNLDACGDEASYAVHEARVRMPRKDNLRGAKLSLRVTGMDEGLRVEVNDRLVAQLDGIDGDTGQTEVDVIIPHIPATVDGDYIVRVVSLNDCDAARDAEVQWVLTGALSPDFPRPDAGVTTPPAPDAGSTDPGADTAPAGGCGCRSGGGSGTGGAILMMMALAVALRRRGSST